MIKFLEILRNNILRLKNKGAIHIFVGSFLTKFVAFFGSVFLVRVLSKSTYGILGYIENFYNYAYVLTGMGLGNAVLRYVVLGKNCNEKYSYYIYARNKGSIYNILLIILVGMAYLFYPHPKQFSNTDVFFLLLLLALPFQFIVDSNQLTLRAMFDNKRYALNAFVISTSLVFFRYIFALYLDLYGVILSKILIYIFFAILLNIIVKKMYFYKVSFYDLGKKTKREVDKYSLQYMITNALWKIFMLNDTFLLGQLAGDPEILADYKVAYVLPGNLSIISASIGIFVVPYFISHEQDYKWIKNNYFKIFFVNFLIIGNFSMILFIFAEPIITLLYGAQYSNIVFLMRLLIIASFCNSVLRYTSANLLSAMGQVRYNMYVSLAGVLLQVLFNIVLIPQFGAVGVAYTSIFVYFIMAIILFIVFSKKYNLLRG